MKNLVLYLLLAAASCSFAQQPVRLFFMEGKLTGYADETGKTVIPPTFIYATDFSEGLAVAAKGDNMFSAPKGYIDYQGKWVIEPAFSAADQFSEGLARVQVNGKWGYIDKTGKTVIQPQFQLCYEFKNGYAQAQSEGKWGLIDKSGKFIIQPTYISITDFSGKVFGAQKTYSDKWRIYDLKENVVGTESFNRLGNFSNGLAPIRNDDALWGFINESGQLTVNAKYTGAHVFSEGLASVQLNYDKWGFINTGGELVINAQFDAHAIFRNGYARVERGNEIRYINKQGQVVFTFAR